MSKTIAEKILSTHCQTKDVAADDIINASVDLAMSHDNTAAVLSILQAIKKISIWDDSKIAVILDHRTPANHSTAAENHKIIRDFATKYNIKHFFDVGSGICHQLIAENNLALPGMLIVGTDSHTTTYGAFGAFAIGIGTTEMAAVWLTGKIWLKVPQTLLIQLQGRPQKHVSVKDIILYIIGKLGVDAANYKACEFSGEYIKTIGVDSRLCICNQSTELGAKAALISPDDITYNYLKSYKNLESQQISADDDATYEKKFEFDTGNIEPQVACPHSVDNVVPVKKVKEVEINQAVIGSCTNGRLEDLAVSAHILKGNTVARNVRMLIIPASKRIYQQALEMGYIKIFLDAKALVLPPGCGPCLGLHQGVLADGETAIATTNRNFIGRMGSIKSQIYLASPATVAASAIKGSIHDSEEFF